MKNDKKYITWVFLFQNYSKFWSIPLGHFIKHKPLNSEEWYLENNLQVVLHSYDT